MPPAFNLSQDQTLEFNHCYYFICFSFLKRRAQNYRLVFLRSFRFCIIPFVFSSTWFFMSWNSIKIRCPRLSVRYCVFKERRCWTARLVFYEFSFSCQASVLRFFRRIKKPLLTLSGYLLLVAGAGFEPTTFGLWARRATELLHPAVTKCIKQVSLYIC